MKKLNNYLFVMVLGLLSSVHVSSMVIDESSQDSVMSIDAKHDAVQTECDDAEVAGLLVKSPRNFSLLSLVHDSATPGSVACSITPQDGRVSGSAKNLIEKSERRFVKPNLSNVKNVQSQQTVVNEEVYDVDFGAFLDDIEPVVQDQKKRSRGEYQDYVHGDCGQSCKK